MSGPLSLRDYTRYSSDSGAWDKGQPVRHISQKDLEFLQRLQEELEGRDCVFLASAPREEEEEKPQVIKTLGANLIQTQGYVGSLVFQGRTVTIRSRFDGKDSLFLRYLLENAWGVSSLVTPEPEGPTELEQEELCRWRLVCQLAVQLQTAWKKGAFRAYRTFSQCDSRVRGQLDIPQHIRLTMGLNDGRAACRTREYSLDNPYNRLILCAMEAAQRRYPQLTRRLLRQLPECSAAVGLLRQLPGTQQDEPQVLLERTRRKIVHPIHRGYEDVRLTARAVLRQMGQGLRGQDRTVGILLNMDQLWEEFLAKVLFRGTAGRFQQLSREILEGRMWIRPDFYWEEERVVLDAKNRPVWGEVLAPGPWSEYVRDDVYQVLSYMLALNCPNGGVIFPVCRSKREVLPPAPLRVSGLEKGWAFWRVPFVIPNDADSYGEFQEAVAQQAEAIRSFRATS